MKKILLSLVAIVAVAGLVIGATIAYYNDTETSAGNIFVAGSVDLKVDHTKQTYNGVDCKTCDVEVVSDETNMVVAKNNVPLETPTNAVAVSYIHPAWTASIPGAIWIWATDPITQEDVITDASYTFRQTFTWMGPITGATLNLGLAADNSYEVWINGTSVGSDIYVHNYSSVDTIVGISDNIVQGLNTIEFKVTNQRQVTGSPATNPAGLLYKLTIDGNCGDAYFQNHCSLWQETDLTGQQFFQFDDVKPGDFGTNVISLHIYDNDSYACLIVGDKENAENTVYESEGDDNDETGELSQYINVFVWGDDGDGVYEPDSESSYGSGSLAELENIMSMDSGNSQYLTSANVSNIGLAWCAGDLSVDEETDEFICNGSGMLNNAQSDSFTATLTAYAEQVRNNDAFLCSGVELVSEIPE